MWSFAKNEFSTKFPSFYSHFSVQVQYLWGGGGRSPKVMVGYGIFVSVILVTYSNPWGRRGGRSPKVMVLPVGAVGVTGVVGVAGVVRVAGVAGVVGVRNSYLSPELPDRPETTPIVFLAPSSPCSAP